MLKHILRVLLLLIVIAALAVWWLMQPDRARLSNAELTGRVPTMSSPRDQIIPTVNVAEAVGWREGQTPKAAPGLTVAAFARGLDHPRNLYVLPNGDVLVAETNAPERDQSSITGKIQTKMMAKAGAVGASANRITLLRDADGDGVAEVKTPFLTGLNSPYGMALIGSKFYVANTDAVLEFDYRPGATSIATAGRKIVDLPHRGRNNHWAKTMVAAPNGFLYVGIGSNSNIGEDGLAWERGRARIIEVRPAIKYWQAWATGLRNPSGLAINPANGALWTTVNERDMLGSDMVPDYMSEVTFGDFFGWPWYYWGGFLDARVEADYEDRREYVHRPDYALGAHAAALGFSFVSNPALGEPFTRGVFVALHGSWNRQPAAGYAVQFIAFGDNGKPASVLPLTVLDGFITADGKAMGRPTDARQARDGALLVADDVGNVVWRVSRAER